ncbi:ROK family transcriptional regulator [Thalassococcus sp. BH17M4-6]|uniref:ROK family transcriptional regulator n=1 Tax=Thalassococcus sp. BH17M4-6 TaxID=3413148 RepID=UPI003BBE8063
MRAHNERLVLSILRRQGPMAKANIARLTGLSAQTVSVIMRSLEEDGLLSKGEPVRGKVGQPSVPMHLAPDGAFFFGLKVGRRSLVLVLTDFLGQVQGRLQRLHAYPTPDATIDFTLKGIAELTADLPPRSRARIAGLGIAMPFQLWDWAKALGLSPEAMSAWKDRDTRAELAEHLKMPVYLQNDASAACGAELVFGTSDRPQDFLYFYIGYFIGGGVVLNGSLFTGRSGNAGALGSMPVPDGQDVVQLIDIASLSVLERLVSQAGDSADSLWPSADGWEIDATILQGWIDRTAAGLAAAVVAACTLIDFEAALIDGWIPASVRAALVARTAEHLQAHNLAGIQPPHILAGTAGPEARALGAASLPLSERFLVDQNAILKQT